MGEVLGVEICQVHLVFAPVALTRAAKWAYFSTTTDQSLSLLEKLLPLEQSGQLTVRRGDQSRGPSPPPRPPNGALDFLQT
jgi:hypothetical protein